MWCTCITAWTRIALRWSNLYFLLLQYIYIRVAYIITKNYRNIFVLVYTSIIVVDECTSILVYISWSNNTSFSSFKMSCSGTLRSHSHHIPIKVRWHSSIYIQVVLVQRIHIKNNALQVLESTVPETPSPPTTHHRHLQYKDALISDCGFSSKTQVERAWYKGWSRSGQ